MHKSSVHLRFIVLLIGVMTAIFSFVPSAYGKASLPSTHDETLGSLIYAQESQQGCKVMRWSMETRQSRLLVSIPECPHAISVADHGRKAMLLNAADMQILDLTSAAKSIISIPLPQPTLPKGAGPANEDNPVATNAGYGVKGDLMVVMEYVAPASDTYYYLFVRHESTWMQIETLHCGTYESHEDCHLKHKLDGRNVGDVESAGPTQIWGDELNSDPYFLKRISLPAPKDDEQDGSIVYKYGLVFDFGQERRTLTYVAFADSEGGDGPLTEELVLDFGQGKSIALEPDQFAAAVMGHYVLYRNYGGPGFRLVDLSDGQVILKDMATAGWVY